MHILTIKYFFLHGEHISCSHQTDGKVSSTGPSDATQELQGEGTHWEASSQGAGEYIYIMRRQLPKKEDAMILLYYIFSEKHIKKYT